MTCQVTLQLVGTDGTASVHEVVGGTAMMADAERRTCRPLPGSSLTTPRFWTVSAEYAGPRRPKI
jgi:hypothetical protein